MTTQTTDRSLAVQAIPSWTGARANALREALRMSNEAFAAHLGVAPRTVANWRSRPGIVPVPMLQELLDVALERAPDRVKAQFSLLLRSGPAGVDLASAIPEDEAQRVRAIEERPSRLDEKAISQLAGVLSNQRRVEDALGTAVVLPPMALQLEALTRTLRAASGPLREELIRVVAEWTSYVGWLHTSERQYGEALQLFRRAEELADEVGEGTIAATATSFRGYVARLQGRPREVIRASAAALATPGAHETQRVYDTLQTAQGYADLGDRASAREALHRASDLATGAGEPPASVYWYTEPFFRLNIGMAQLGIGDFAAARDSLASGIADIPADQRNADWMTEYRQALDYASERA